MTAEEVHLTLRAAHDKVELRKPDHLYVPGRVILVYEPWISGAEADDPALHPTSEKISAECTLVDGTAPALRCLEIDGIRMFTDHLTSSYYEVMGMEYAF